MLRVRTYLAPSAVHGIGCFAAEDIPARALVWSPGELDHFRANAAAFPPELAPYVFRAAPGLWCLSADNDRFVNHAAVGAANIGYESLRAQALRDISAGEELLQDYAEFGMSAEQIAVMGVEVEGA